MNMNNLEAVLAIAKDQYNQTDDVHVIEVASLDDEHQKNFHSPYIVQFVSGDVIEFDTDEAACLFQRLWRKQLNRDEMTGDPL